MLALVRRLSRDLGIRVLLSTHLLEDVTATCDAVVLLRDGVVAASGRIDELVRGDAGRVRIRVSGDRDAFVAALMRRGVETTADGDALLSVAALDEIRDAACEAGVGIRELIPGGQTIEDALVGVLT
jgi:ABC-type multidrug transport system ATPase subunit